MKKSNEEAYKMAHYIHSWLKEYTLFFKSNSSHTIKSYSHTLSLFINFLQVEKNVAPSNFCSKWFARDYIEEWILWLKYKRNNSPETCNNRLASLRAFLKYLSDKEISFLHLSIGASQIPRQKTMRKKVNGMSKKAMQALMSVPNISTKTGRRDLVLLIVIYNTAVRIDEILSMKLRHLHLEANKPYTTVIGKGSKIRTLYLLPRAVEHLKKYLKEFHAKNSDPDSYLFYSRNTGVMGKMSQAAVNKQLKKYAFDAHTICEEVPLKLHAHQIRHAKASHWLEDGMNIVQISFLLGHANIQTTMTYLDITTEQEAKALATLEDEDKRGVSKKWKLNLSNLSSFCGVDEIQKK